MFRTCTTCQRRRMCVAGIRESETIIMMIQVESFCRWHLRPKRKVSSFQSLLQNPTKKELENHSHSQQINTSERVARERTSESFYQNLPAGMRALRDDDVLINCNPGHPLTQVGVSEPSDVRQLICASAAAWSLKFPNFSRRFRVRVHTWLVHSSLHSNDLQTTEKSHDFNRVSP